MPDSGNHQRFLRRQEAADYLKSKWGIQCSPNYLAKLAVVGGGPEFHKAGAFPLYPEPSLDKYAVAKLGPLVRSTSELVEAA